MKHEPIIILNDAFGNEQYIFFNGKKVWSGDSWRNFGLTQDDSLDIRDLLMCGDIESVVGMLEMGTSKVVKINKI